MKTPVKALALCGLLLVAHISHKTKAQGGVADTTLQSYQLKGNQAIRRGMYTLGGLGVAGVATGGILWATAPASNHYQKGFGQMHLAWSAVNLALAAPALLTKTRPVASSWRDALEQQGSYERLFLVNAGIDVGYFAAGGWLAQYARSLSDAALRGQFQGMGHAVMINGATLLAFDAIMYGLLRRNYHWHRKQIPI